MTLHVRRYFSDGAHLASTTGMGQARPKGPGGVPLPEVTAEVFDAAMDTLRAAAIQPLPEIDPDDEAPTLESRVAALEAAVEALGP